MKFTIYINEAPFTADSKTIDLIVEALLSSGWSFDEQTQGYVSQGFYDRDSWGACGKKNPIFTA